MGTKIIVSANTRIPANVRSPKRLNTMVDEDRCPSGCVGISHLLGRRILIESIRKRGHCRGATGITSPLARTDQRTRHCLRPRKVGLGPAGDEGSYPVTVNTSRFARLR